MKKIILLSVLLLVAGSGCDRINIFDEVTGVAIQTATSNLHIGDTIKLETTANLKSGKTKTITSDITYTSSDENIIKIEKVGSKIQAKVVMDGSADITVTYAPGADYTFNSTATATVNAVTGINLWSNEHLLDNGSTTTLNCEIVHADGEKRQAAGLVTYATSDGSVVTVTADGIVTGVGTAGDSADINGEFTSPSSGTHSADATFDIVNAFYVAPDGDDGDDGSKALPFLTIQKALDESTGGELIKVAAGEHTISASILLNADDPSIVIKGGYQRSDWQKSHNNLSVIIDERTTGTGPVGAIELKDNTGGTSISDLTIIGPSSGDAAWAGIKCDNSSPSLSNIIINLRDTNNDGNPEVFGKSTGSLYGIYIKDSQPWVSNCYIYGGEAPQSYGIYITEAASTNGPNIISNHIIGGKSGLSTAIHASMSSVMAPFPIYNNILVAGFGEWSTAVVAYGNARPAVYNNTINLGTGTVYARGVETVYSAKPFIANNIFFTDTAAATTCGIYEGYNDADPVVTTNNNFYNLASAYRDLDSTTYITTGPEINANASVAIDTTASGNITINPVFQDPAKEFRLSADSPVEITEGGLNGIDQGWTNFPTDMNGNGVDRQWFSRPAPGNPWSIGAYQNK